MAKGDQNAIKDSVATQTDAGNKSIAALTAQNVPQTAQMGANYTGAVANNTSNYADVMNSYKQFLAQQPNAGGLLTNFLGTNNTAARTPLPQTNQTTPNANGITTQPLPRDNSGASADGAPTNDMESAVKALYAKYGVKDTGPGTGLTDLSYWKGDALNNAKGDSQYVLGRLESDLQGSGPDKAAPGGGGPRSGGFYDESAIQPAIAGYTNFANTGGFSPEDIQSIRARAIAPIRSLADRNSQEIQRQAAIRGTGYSPNTAAALAKTGRDANYATADATTNAEAAIAGLRQQGQLSGLSGLAGIGNTNRGMDLSQLSNLRGQDLSAILGSGQQQLGGLSGMTGLYGATPGMSNTFGNQVLASGAQGIDIGKLQQGLGAQNINGMGLVAQTPSTSQNVATNIGNYVKIASSIAGMKAGV